MMKLAPAILKRNQILLQGGFLAAACLLIAFTTTPYLGIAGFAFSLMTLGVSARRERKIHQPLMISAVIIDISLVLFLELTRSAVETAMTEPLNLLQRTHILSSLGAVILYIPAIYFGFRSSPRHRKLGPLAYGLRLIGFLTMFSMKQ